jgi:hypothetical protein
MPPQQVEQRRQHRDRVADTPNAVEQRNRVPENPLQISGSARVQAAGMAIARQPPQVRGAFGVL